MSNSIRAPRQRLAHCNCGSLSARTMGEPLIVVACFCEECQRRTASVVGISTYWPREDVQLSGAATRYTRDCQGGRKATYYFCPTCGSSVYWEAPERRPGQLGISVGSFFDLDFPAPSLAVWERSKPAWLTVPVAERYRENPPPPVSAR